MIVPNEIYSNIDVQHTYTDNSIGTIFHIYFYSGGRIEAMYGN